MSKVQLQCVRGLHFTSRRNNFFSWFKSKKQQEVQVQDTKDVIKDIESGKSQVDNGSPSNRTKLDMTPSNFIGQQSEDLEKGIRDQQVKNVEFNRWLSIEKVNTEKQLDAVLNESWKLATGSGTPSLDQSFPDLVSKFKFSKNLQSKTGYMVPDFQITVSKTPQHFKDYYIKEILSGKLLKFKESEPNAIDLSEKDYGSPNVYIVNDIATKERNRKFGKIIKEVHALEQENLRNVVEGTKRG